MRWKRRAMMVVIMVALMVMINMVVMFMKMRKDSLLYLIYCSLIAENSSCPAVSKISSRATW